jgi:hypothetical protein
VGAADEGERERGLLAAAAAFCEFDGTPQVNEGPFVGARVRGRQAEHRFDPGPLLVRVGQRARPLEALSAAGVARLQDVDIRKLAVGRGGNIAHAVLLGERGGTKQCIRSLLVATAGRVDQRCAEGEPGLRFELVRFAGFGLRRRAGERANARLEAAGVDRRAASLEAGTGGLLSGGSSRGDGRRRPRLRGAKDGGTGSAPVLGAKELQAGRDLPIRRLPVAGLGVAADEQLLEVLVVRVQFHEARRKLDGRRRLTCRQAVERRFVEGRLGRADEAAALDQEPRLEGG